MNIASFLGTISKVKLRGGVVGKVALVLICLIPVIGILAWSIGNVWVTAGSILLLILLVFIVAMRLISFANKNPQAAILDGAEFILHQQLLLGSKGNPIIASSIIEMVEGNVQRLAPDQAAEAGKPDAPQSGSSGSMNQPPENSHG